MDYAKAEVSAALAALVIVSVFGVVTLAVIAYFKWAWASRAQPYRVPAATAATAANAANPPAIELASLPPAPAVAAPPASADEAV